MAQYVDIMTDAGFKAVFQDKQVTIKFLNAALAGERQIKDKSASNGNIGCYPSTESIS